jgi:TolB protein
MKLRRLWCALLLGIACGGSAAAAADSALIAYVNEGGEIHTIAGDGSNDRTLAVAGQALQPIAFSFDRVAEERNFFTWPVWSPDSRRIAAFRVSRGEAQAVVDSLYVIDVESTRVVERYERPGLRPIYAYWSPDGERLAMLLQIDQGFSLSIWPHEASERPRSLAVGAPFFYDWARDGKNLLLHVGNDPDSPAGHSVTLLEIASGDRASISKAPAVFGPASYSHDGKWLAHAAMGEKGARLVVASADQRKEKLSVEVSPRVAFNWAPNRAAIAVATTESEDHPVYTELRLVDVATGKTRTLRKEPISAFFWSPNGASILLATRDLESGGWQWVVVDARTGDARKLGKFFPSRPQIMVFQYFDQYALSHRLWSPDGKSFVFSGAAENDPASPHPVLSPKVYVVDAKGTTPARGIADGHTAFWSPR